MKAGNTECTIKPVGSSTVQKVSFPGSSVGPNLFQAPWLISGFFFFQAVHLMSAFARQLGMSGYQSLCFSGRLAGLRVSPNSSHCWYSLREGNACLVNLLRFEDILDP